MGFWAKFVDDTEKSVNPIIVATGLLTLAVIAWGCWECYHTNHMPSNLEGAAYLIGGAGAANLAHKATDIVEKIKGPQSFPTPPPVAPPK